MIFSAISQHARIGLGQVAVEHLVAAADLVVRAQGGEQDAAVRVSSAQMRSR